MKKTKITRERYGRFVLYGVHDGGAAAYRVGDSVERRFLGGVYTSPEQPRAALKARLGPTPGAMTKLGPALAAPVVVIAAFFWVWWVLIFGLVRRSIWIVGHVVRTKRGTQTDEQANEWRAAVLTAHIDGTPIFLLVSVVGTITVVALMLAINALFL